jgi:hypothetical protein
MAAKGEMLRLKGLNFQLDIANANLRELLRREQDRCRQLEEDVRISSRGSSLSSERVKVRAAVPARSSSKVTALIIADQLLQQALHAIAEQARQAHTLMEEACAPPSGPSPRLNPAHLTDGPQQRGDAHPA